MTVNVLFVCLGNICRSPSAQAIFQKCVDDNNLSDKFLVDSCGTAAFNAGKAPDPRAITAAAQRGYNLSHMIARQINDNDYHKFDFIICMDRKNLSNVQPWAPKDFSGEIGLLMKYCHNGGNTQIPDPYYDSTQQFEEVMSNLERACLGLFELIKTRHQL